MQLSDHQSFAALDLIVNDLHHTIMPANIDDDEA